jgi:hypothetical protein
MNQPPETARLFMPDDPGFRLTNVSSARWPKQRLRRIPFLPNFLDLDMCDGSIVSLLRKFDV